VYQTSSPPR